VPIVLEDEAVRVHSALLGAAAGDRQLLARERDAADPASAGDLLCVDAKATPATADVEDAHAGLDRQLGEDVPLLDQLRLFQRHVRPLEIGAGVLPVLVKEEIVEAAVDVVVVRDVLVRPVDRIARGPGPEQTAEQGRCLGRQQRPVSPGVLEQDLQQVVDRPLLKNQPALHEELTELQLGIPHEFGQRPAIGQAHDHPRRRTVAGHETLTAGQDDLQLSVLDEGGQQPFQDALAEQGSTPYALREAARCRVPGMSGRYAGPEEKPARGARP
jgi:hypothetical protein